ncbi:nuclear transport factor 2 family protein [Rahnella sp. SAP-1]|uniref:Nuclear transport factor 2 family protein n=1 Tax=Rouxiella aceris TaxID=2703884 RepID=A0A848MHD6_9GAMM|nr:nuclear transport factor 2 family protein [Rouxiella aceris]NMP26422.1 nuclear transport factor 2 family protein [Rouxiella aceris]
MIHSLPDGIPRVNTTLDRLIEFYRRLDHSQLPQLSRLYHQNIVFIDPVTHHIGVDALERYFAQLLTQTNYCRFDIQNALSSGDETMLIWRMTYSHPRLKRGKELVIDGSSHLRFNEDRVIYQRDYYDLGAMLYEHIPLLASAVKAVKSRLAE